jgi:hypothetical protein
MGRTGILSTGGKGPGPAHSHFIDVTAEVRSLAQLDRDGVRTSTLVCLNCVPGGFTWRCPAGCQWRRADSP